MWCQRMTKWLSAEAKEVAAVPKGLESHSAKAFKCGRYLGGEFIIATACNLVTLASVIYAITGCSKVQKKLSFAAWRREVNAMQSL